MSLKLWGQNNLCEENSTAVRSMGYYGLKSLGFPMFDSSCLTLDEFHFIS